MSETVKQILQDAQSQHTPGITLVNEGVEWSIDDQAEFMLRFTGDASNDYRQKVLQDLKAAPNVKVEANSSIIRVISKSA